jgi:hypothetical protein
LQNKAVKADSTFAPSSKEMHQKAIDLPIIANWNPLKNPLRDDFDGDGMHVERVIVPLAAYCETMLGGVAARREITRWRGDGCGGASAKPKAHRGRIRAALAMLQNRPRARSGCWPGGRFRQ